MWYVVQVRTGSEESVRMQYEKATKNDRIEKSFIPYYEEMKRYKGVWHRKLRILFPRYIFIIRSEEEQLSDNLRKIVGFTMHFGIENMAVPLTCDEISLI